MPFMDSMPVFKQFLTPKNIIGTASSSRRILILVYFCVCFWTPKIVLQKFIYRFSMGLFLGIFRHPQKSELYNKIGFINESKREIVVQG